MIAATSPILFPGDEACDPRGRDRISAILGRPTTSPLVSRVTERWRDRTHACRLVWFDTDTDDYLMESRKPTIVHILWTIAGQAATIHLGIASDDEADLSSYPISPGDTLVIPAQTPFTIARGVLGILLTEDDPDLGFIPHPSASIVLPATHGLQLFDRYNRRTICAVTDTLVLERWKLTQPQVFNLMTDRWHVLINLVTPVALSWSGGSDLTRRARSYLLPGGMTSIAAIPDNLGYIMLAYRPDLERDVIAPLQAAGYDPDTIATIGVPRERIGR